ncbi:hypothetical protein HY969_03860 [Candidatus Kaiserbacteria bacterium]|nr:hypothetical protein [Candidatus Kaiserbacteria bacterium]
MPSLTDSHIAQYQALYLKRFGVALTKEEVLAKGTQLVHFFATVVRQNERSKRNARPSRTAKG